METEPEPTPGTWDMRRVRDLAAVGFLGVGAVTVGVAAWMVALPAFLALVGAVCIGVGVFAGSHDA